MSALASSEVLDVWEAGRARGSVERGLLLLQLARPELDRDARLDLSVGQRDADLLALRAATFGARAEFTARCACGERLEFELPLKAERAIDAVGAPLRVEHGAYNVLCRLPTSRDLHSVRAKAADIEAAAAELLSHCVLAVTLRGEPCELALLPLEAAHVVIDRIQEADPRAYMTVELNCPACLATWSEAIDVVACVWADVAAAALRILQEVHILAERYGWSEQSILDLSPSRRRLYLEMATA